jgi:S1-C subfamily serine protease
MKERIAALLFVFLLFPLYAAAQDLGSSPQSVAPQTGVKTGPAVMEPKQILQRESPAIVTVTSLDKAGKAISMGSGFIVRSNGVVITNYHVVKGAQDAQIKLKNGEIYDNVQVLDYDVRRDLVVLKIRAIGLAEVTLGDSATVETGDRAYAIGNPEGLAYTISDGLISGRHIMNGTEMLQISVPISHGSSGGPLYNTFGQVIGITAAGITEEGAQNLNFAIPIKYAIPMLDSTPQNMSLAELTAKMGPTEPEPPKPTPTSKPAVSSKPIEYSDPSGWFEMTLPAGWQLEDPPPEGTMFSASSDRGATLVASHGDSKNADDEFQQLTKALSDRLGKLVVYSEKIKIDHNDGRHARMQTFKISSDGRFVFVGALQNGSRVVALASVCKTADIYDELIEALKTISW